MSEQMALISVTDVVQGPFAIDPALQGVLFCDIDGTIADISHRRPFLEQVPKNWKQFKATLHLDGPVEPIISAVQRLKKAGWRVVLVSGRDEESRDVTVKWLAQHAVPFDALYMRPDGDYRRDDLIKEELLLAARFDGYEPDLIFDDRDQVVQMWRRHGLTCVQVAFGAF